MPDFGEWLTAEREAELKTQYANLDKAVAEEYNTFEDFCFDVWAEEQNLEPAWTPMFGLPYNPKRLYSVLLISYPRTGKVTVVVCETQDDSVATVRNAEIRGYKVSYLINPCDGRSITLNDFDQDDLEWKKKP